MGGCGLSLSGTHSYSQCTLPRIAHHSQNRRRENAVFHKMGAARMLAHGGSVADAQACDGDRVVRETATS